MMLYIYYSIHSHFIILACSFTPVIHLGEVKLEAWGYSWKQINHTINPMLQYEAEFVFWVSGAGTTKMTWIYSGGHMILMIELGGCICKAYSLNPVIAPRSSWFFWMNFMSLRKAWYLLAYSRFFFSAITICCRDTNSTRNYFIQVIIFKYPMVYLWRINFVPMIYTCFFLPISL